MKNKILILTMLCALGIGMSKCKCQNCRVKNAAYYQVSTTNNSDLPIYIDGYSPNGNTPFMQTEIIEPNSELLFFGFTSSPTDGSIIRFVFSSDIDDTTIADTTLVIEPKPYEGIDYKIKMILNADKTLTITTAPVVDSDVDKKEIRF